MNETNKKYLATLLSDESKLPIDCCYDVIDEVIAQVTELEFGNSNYNSIEEIISDYLSLPPEYSLFFIE